MQDSSVVRVPSQSGKSALFFKVLVTECAFSPCTLVLTTTSFFPGHFFTSFPPSPHLYPGHLAATGGIRKLVAESTLPIAPHILD